ncbi:MULTISPECIES: diguanylate cyclase domain-containing protein [Paenibacillus]|uniref:diguanylate cyclase domain-containing protein n=1 Tax=Paenibacillus TaxID=44249 RepID=UPI0022B861B4|nr:diguanylate cyclase [Paenibacillus caseinilyticus]MCZ8518543.1 diguanylate cyclase [Paenibacillus caseinilyticus]
MLMIAGFAATEKLHQGPFTAVYRAREAGGTAEALIKLAGGERTAEAEERLRHEYEIVKRLEPSGLRRTYGLHRTREGLALLLSPLEGAPLSERLKGRPLDVGTFFPLAIAAAEALGKLHGEGILHMDLRPEHILIGPESGQAELIGFALSLPYEEEPELALQLEPSEASFPYMPPERTGRMNRGVDPRTDLYSLGVVYYEMLAGQLPFEAADPIEWAHCHTAKRPKPLGSLAAGIPPKLADLVMKLMAKTASDRYQSASGLIRDLEAFFGEWRRTGEIRQAVPSGQEEVPELLPTRLIGRDGALRTLLEAHREASEGTPGLVIVTGDEGTGKTALVQAMRRRLSEEEAGGVFLSGTCEKGRGYTPYAGLIEAFGQWIRELLTKEEDVWSRWRTILSGALGSNGSVVTRMIPEVEWLLGPQPALEQVPVSETVNRFHGVFRDFLSAIAVEERPLTLFLDDLHAADPGSMHLIRRMLTDYEIPYLLIIGASRPAEEGEIPALQSILERPGAPRVNLRTAGLHPLREDELLELVAESLGIPEAVCVSLSRLLFRKTRGNPFFALQLLQLLRRDRLLRYDGEKGEWTWDEERIERFELPASAAGLLIRSIRGLPARAQELLQLAAAVGRSIPLGILAEAYGGSADSLKAPLRVLIAEGLLYKSEGGVTFTHERVREAAYALMDPERLAAAHAAIGEVLLGSMEEAEREERVFEILGHYHAAAGGPGSVEKIPHRDELIRLHLIAGRRAKNSTAYESAERYLKAGRTLLGADGWEIRYGMMVAVSMELAECHYLTGRHEEAEVLMKDLLGRVRTDREKVEVYSVQVRMYTNLSRFADAIEATRKGLRMFGIEFPDGDVREEIGREMRRARELTGDRPVEELADHPPMEDPRQLLIMSLYTRMVTPLYFVRPDLYALVALRIVNTSILYGNVANSASGYCAYGVILAGQSREYERAYAFGRLSVEVARKYKSKRLQSSVQYMLGGFLSHWCAPGHESLGLLEESWQLAQECGNSLFATYSASTLMATKYHMGRPLAEVYHAAASHIDFVLRTKDQLVNSFTLYLQFVRCLRGQTEGVTSFSDAELDEEAWTAQLKSATERISLLRYYGVKAFTLYLYGAYEAALEQAEASAAMRSQGLGLATWSEAEDTFTHALILTALYPGRTKDRQEESWRELQSLAERLDLWASHAPENFRHKALLVRAGMFRLQGASEAAMAAYEQALDAAKGSGHLKDAAVAAECAAGFYESRGLGVAAKAYLQEAWEAYRAWGALAKASSLEQRYPEWLRDTWTEVRGMLPQAVTGGSPGRAPVLFHDVFDLSTVMKATQLISQEVQLDQLLQRLMAGVIENAGAEKGFLVLQEEEGWIVAAEGALAGSEIVVTQPMEPMEGKLRPRTILAYAVRTKESVVLDDAGQTGMFTQDAYVLREKPKSVLCMPVLKQGHLVALLYLENNLVTHAFSTDRLEMLGMLVSQLAASIENASLYAYLEHKVNLRTRELERANLELRASEERYRTIFENTGTAMIIIGEGDRVALTNSECLRLFEEADLTGRKWYEFIHKDDVARIAGYRSRRLDNQPDAPSSYEVRGVSGTGRVFDMLMTVATIAGTRNVVCSIMDITERKRAEETIRNMAYYDMLTGLPNRKLFEERLSEAVSSAPAGGQQAAVLFLDLDGFKQVNDTYGHKMGDLLLIESAQRLQGVCADSGLVSRLGGDEFIVLLTGITGEAEARRAAGRIFSAFQDPAQIDGAELAIRTSIGIALYPEDGSDAESLVKRADEAMYRAKKRGKNRYEFYSQRGE